MVRTHRIRPAAPAPSAVARRCESKVRRPECCRAPRLVGQGRDHAMDARIAALAARHGAALNTSNKSRQHQGQHNRQGKVAGLGRGKRRTLAPSCVTGRHGRRRAQSSPCGRSLPGSNHLKEPVALRRVALPSNSCAAAAVRRGIILSSDAAAESRWYPGRRVFNLKSHCRTPGCRPASESERTLRLSTRNSPATQAAERFKFINYWDVECGSLCQPASVLTARPDSPESSSRLMWMYIQA